jgi:hypothetical protein
MTNLNQELQLPFYVDLHEGLNDGIAFGNFLISAIEDGFLKVGTLLEFQTNLTRMKAIFLSWTMLLFIFQPKPQKCFSMSATAMRFQPNP